MATLPLHLQISEMLIREIKAGLRPVGDRLPPERNLASDLGVSVGTLRKALADLADKGMLERVQGSGNYVRNNPEVDNIYALFRLERVEGGGLPTAQLLDVTKMTPPGCVPALSDAPHVFRFRRIRSLDGAPVAAEEMFLAGARASSVAPEDVGDSLYQFYRDRLGFRITRVEDRVGVGQRPDWAKPYFESRPPEGWGYIERKSRDETDQLAEFSRTWFDPATARFVAR